MVCVEKKNSMFLHALSSLITSRPRSNAILMAPPAVWLCEPVAATGVLRRSREADRPPQRRQLETLLTRFATADVALHPHHVEERLLPLSLPARPGEDQSDYVVAGFFVEGSSFHASQPACPCARRRR